MRIEGVWGIILLDVRRVVQWNCSSNVFCFCLDFNLVVCVLCVCVGANFGWRIEGRRSLDHKSILDVLLGVFTAAFVVLKALSDPAEHVAVIVGAEKSLLPGDL